MRVGETLTARWRRRSLTLPLCFVATALVWSLSWALLPLALVIDLVLRRRLAAVRFLLTLLVKLTFESFGVVAALLIWPFAGFRSVHLTLNFGLQRWWAHGLWPAALRIYGMRVEVEEPEALAGAGPVLLLMRHVSLLDTLLPTVLAGWPHHTRLRYVLKAALLGDPCFDVVGNRLPNVFVRQGRDVDLAALRDLGRDLRPDEGVIIYPEGTRFTPAKRARRVAKLRERGDVELLARAEALVHLMPPIPAGTLALLETMAPCDVVVVGHQGLEGAVTLDEPWRGELIGGRVRVHLRRIPAADVPADPDARAAWLFDTWQRLHDWQAQVVDDA